MRWWQSKKRDADLEREMRSDLDLGEEEQRAVNRLRGPDSAGGDHANSSNRRMRGFVRAGYRFASAALAYEEHLYEDNLQGALALENFRQNFGSHEINCRAIFRRDRADTAGLQRSGTPGARKINSRMRPPRHVPHRPSGGHVGIRLALAVKERN